VTYTPQPLYIRSTYYAPYGSGGADHQIFAYDDDEAASDWPTDAVLNAGQPVAAVIYKLADGSVVAQDEAVI
jgi:hypothetical protein